MTPIFEMHKLGWIQIDPAKPINEQVAVGDYVINIDNPQFFDGTLFKDHKFKQLKYNCEVIDISLGFILKGYIDEYYLSRKDSTWLVLKSCNIKNVNYVNVKVPDFMLDKVKQLGGIEI